MYSFIYLHTKKISCILFIHSIKKGTLLVYLCFYNDFEYSLYCSKLVGVFFCLQSIYCFGLSTLSFIGCSIAIRIIATKAAADEIMKAGNISFISCAARFLK